VFVGTVGAGKSTQIKLLASALKRNKLRVKIAFLKSGHLLAYVLEVILVRLLMGSRKEVYPIKVLVDERQNLFRKIFKFWLILDVVSISIRFLLTIYIKIKMQRVVLVEEYFAATIADYAYLAGILGLPTKTIFFAVSFILRLLYLGGNIQTVFLDASDTSLEARWRHRASPKEDHRYLQMQRTLLLSVSKRVSQTFIYIQTGGQTVEKTHESIVTHLEKIMGIKILKYPSQFVQLK
jgi:thymidylate kinase